MHLDEVQSHVVGQLWEWSWLDESCRHIIYLKSPHKVDMRASCSQTRWYAFCSLYTRVAAYLLMDQ